MNRQLLLLSILIFTSLASSNYYFENPGCIKLTYSTFQCRICDQGYDLEGGICKMTDFNHTVKSDHPYQRIYSGEQIVTAAANDSILARVITTVKQHTSYFPSITMIKQTSQVTTRTNYRIMCQSTTQTADFYVYYIYNTDSIKIVDVNVTKLVSNASSNKRLLAISSSGFSSSLSSLIKLLTNSKSTTAVPTPAGSVITTTYNPGTTKANPTVIPVFPGFSINLPSNSQANKNITIQVIDCYKFIKHKNFVHTKSMTHRWSPHRKHWDNQINLLHDKWSKCISDQSNNRWTPKNYSSRPTSSIPVISKKQVRPPKNISRYLNDKCHHGSVTITQDEVYKTQNNLPSAYFTQDVKMVVQLFSIQQKIDLSNSIIFIEYHGDGVVDEYAITAKFRANDTVRFYAIRIISSNQYLFMGKNSYASTFDPSLLANQFLTPITAELYNVADLDLFTQLSTFITANNNTHFNLKILQITKRVYPNGTYYITNIHIDNDVDAISHAIKLNGGTFMNIKYQQVSIYTPIAPVQEPVPQPTPVIITDPTSSESNTSQGSGATVIQTNTTSTDTTNSSTTNTTGSTTIVDTTLNTTAPVDTTVSSNTTTQTTVSNTTTVDPTTVSNTTTTVNTTQTDNSTTPVVNTTSTTNETTVDPTPVVNTTTVVNTSSCCSTLQQKQDASVVYLKHYYKEVPHLNQAGLVYTQNQALPSGVSFDFYLQYADDLISMGYQASVARYNDGTYAILMFDYA